MWLEKACNDVGGRIYKKRREMRYNGSSKLNCEQIHESEEYFLYTGTSLLQPDGFVLALAPKRYPGAVA